MRRLIVTADDFGLSLPINEAVELAHRCGILTAASLMVGAPAAQDAIERARRMPNLGIGLHLVLASGMPVLPPGAIPALVGTEGLLSKSLFGKGVAIYMRASVRRQMEAEVRAQFEAFRRTGLPLDHVNGHHHFHLHPSVIKLIVALASEFGVRAVRVPYEPLWRSWRVMREGFGRRFALWLLHLLPVLSIRRRLRMAGIASNRIVFGFYDSGRMTRNRLLRLLKQSPEGAAEFYCHPATRRWSGPFAMREDYRCVEEFEALLDPEVVAATRDSGIEMIPFAALSAPARRA